MEEAYTGLRQLRSPETRPAVRAALYFSRRADSYSGHEHNRHCSSGSLGTMARTTGCPSVARPTLCSRSGFEQCDPVRSSNPLTQAGAFGEPPAGRMRGLDGEPGRRLCISAAQFFASTGPRHMELFGTSPEAFARYHGPDERRGCPKQHAVFRGRLTMEDLLASPQLQRPLTRLQACPPTGGGAATVVVVGQFADREVLQTRFVLTGATGTHFRSRRNVLRGHAARCWLQRRADCGCASRSERLE